MKKTGFVNRWFVLMLMWSVSGAAQTNQDSDIELAWSKLREGTAVAIMRHALAPGYSDPAGFDKSDCSTQRNLSDQGRRQAKLIGKIFRKQQITDARLYSSQWCRCVDTAELLDLGPVIEMQALNSFFENRAAGPEQNSELQSILTKLLQPGAKPVVMVSHQVNINALTGTGTSSGETLIIALEAGKVRVLARISAPL